MRVERVKISGFRSIREIETKLGQNTALVGENSSGKSTILQAIYLLLSSSNKIEELDFHKVVPHIYEELFIECTFIDFTADESEQLEEMFGPIGASLTIRKRGDSNSLRLYPEIDIPEYKNKLLDLDYPSGSTKKEYLKAVEVGEIPEYILGADGKARIGDIVAGVKRYIKENVDKLETTGFTTRKLKTKDFNSLLEILPEPLYVPAFDDIGKQVKYMKTNILGKLLDQVFVDLRETGNTDFKRMELQINSLTSKFKSDSKNRIDQIHQLETKLSGYVGDILPESRAQIAFNLPPIEQLMQQYFQIKLDDGVITPVDKKGHGAQRTLIWALLRTYLDNLSDREASNVLFLIEEPELYLHPQAQRVMLGVLNKLSDKDQVLYSTHSPIFIPMDCPENIILIRKRQKQTTIDHISEQTISFRKNQTRFLTWIDDSRAEIFFARSVVIVEGDTEKVLMGAINKEAVGGKTLDELGCQVLITGGKFSMPFYCNLLSDIGIPFFVIFDHDSSSGQHEESNNHIKDAVKKFNAAGGYAKYHIFHPFFEKDWGIEDAGSKIENIFLKIEEWIGSDTRPAKYTSLTKDIYEFATESLTQR